MTDRTPTEKQHLRREKLQARRDLAPDYRKSADLSICARVETLPEYRQAKTVAAYAGDGTEPDLIPLLRKARAEGKTICFPRWREQDSRYEMAVADEAFTLVEGKWKMPEPPRDAPSMPQDMLRKALWLVPGVAFDQTERISVTRLIFINRSGNIICRIQCIAYTSGICCSDAI